VISNLHIWHAEVARLIVGRALMKAAARLSLLNTAGAELPPRSRTMTTTLRLQLWRFGLSAVRLARFPSPCHLEAGEPSLKRHPDHVSICRLQAVCLWPRPERRMDDWAAGEKSKFGVGRRIRSAGQRPLSMLQN
jgi:hypothetical protein